MPETGKHTCHGHNGTDCWDEDCETCSDCNVWPCGPVGKVRYPATPQPESTAGEMGRLAAAVLSPSGEDALDCPWVAQPDGLGMSEWEIVYTPASGPLAGESTAVASCVSHRQYAEHIVALHNRPLTVNAEVPCCGRSTDPQPNERKAVRQVVHNALRFAWQNDYSIVDTITDAVLANRSRRETDDADAGLRERVEAALDRTHRRGEWQVRQAIHAALAEPTPGSESP